MAYQKRKVVDFVDYLIIQGWVVKEWHVGTLVRKEKLGLQGGASCFISSMSICKFNDDDKIMCFDNNKKKPKRIVVRCEVI